MSNPTKFGTNDLPDLDRLKQIADDLAANYQYSAAEALRAVIESMSRAQPGLDPDRCNGTGCEIGCSNCMPESEAYGAEAQVFFNGAWKPASEKAFYCTSEKNRRVVDRPEGEVPQAVAQVHLDRDNWMDIKISDLPLWGHKKFKTRTLYAAPAAQHAESGALVSPLSPKAQAYFVAQSEEAKCSTPQPGCQWPSCLSESAQNKLADEVAESLGLGPDVERGTDYIMAAVASYADDRSAGTLERIRRMVAEGEQARAAQHAESGAQADRIKELESLVGVAEAELRCMDHDLAAARAALAAQSQGAQVGPIGALTDETLAEMLLGKHVTELGYRMLINGDQVEFSLQELLDIVRGAALTK